MYLYFLIFMKRLTSAFFAHNITFLSYHQSKLYLIFFLKVDEQQRKTCKSVKQKKRSHDTFFIRVHHLVCCIPYRICCYSNSQPYINHSFYKKPHSSHSCHVPCYKPDRSWYVCWRIFSLSFISRPLILMRHCENELKPGTECDN